LPGPPPPLAAPSGVPTSSSSAEMSKSTDYDDSVAGGWGLFFLEIVLPAVFAVGCCCLFLPAAADVDASRCGYKKLKSPGQHARRRPRTSLCPCRHCQHDRRRPRGGETRASWL
jgi:hypothetical protein